MNENALRCEEAVRRLAAYLDHELDDSERAALSRHLATCRSCCSRAEFEKRLRARVSELRRLHLDPDFEERVKTLLSGFRSASTAE